MTPTTPTTPTTLTTETTNTAHPRTQLTEGPDSISPGGPDNTGPAGGSDSPRLPGNSGSTELLTDTDSTGDPASAGATGSSGSTGLARGSDSTGPGSLDNGGPAGSSDSAGLRASSASMGPRGGSAGAGPVGGSGCVGAVGSVSVELERMARVGLSRVVEPGDPAALEAFEGLSALEVWELLRSGAPRVERWAGRLANVDAERDLERAHAVGGRFVIPGDDEWPEQIEVLADAGQQARRGGVPFGLWVRGEANLQQALEKSVAVVGSRACSSYGEHAAAELAAGLADNQVTVVSGGAYGVDAAAHRGALAASGLTIAVLACGVDVSYPKRNTALFDRIAAEGLIVSELPPACSPTKLRFLARNRLIAASTLGTLVVEAAVRSGALNSAGWAEQCGRAVLAVPGPITSRMSEGAHLLVRERNAVLVTSIADILEAIAPLGTELTSYPHAPAEPTDGFDLEVRRTLDAVPVLRPAPAARIAVTAGLDTATVQECLETLADATLIEYTPTGWRLSPTHRQSLGTP